MMQNWSQCMILCKIFQMLVDAARPRCLTSDFAANLPSEGQNAVWSRERAQAT